MSDSPPPRQARREREKRPPSAATGIVAAAAALIAAAQLGQFWEGLEGAERFRPPGPTGSLQSVTFVNGQIYYGTLEAVGDNTVTLSDVFYVQVEPPNVQADKPLPGYPLGHNRLMRRRDSDWHGPDRMAIPTSKIMMMELVGPTSQIGNVIATVRQNGPGH